MDTLDVSLLIELNRWISQSAFAYEVALFAVQHLLYVVAMLLIVMLWFSGDDNPDDPLRSLRGTHRQRALFLLFVSLTALIVARAIAASIGRMPPDEFLIRVPDTIVSGTYPADLTAFWSALTIGLALYYHPAPGILSALVGAILAGLAVAVGAYFPLDLIAGIAVGVIVFTTAWWLRRWLRQPIRMVILGVHNYSSVFYPLGALIMLDSTQQFLGVSQFIEWLFRVSLVR